MNQQAMMKLRKMQKQMMEAQEKLESTVFTGTAQAGLVTVEVMGNHKVLSVKIDPEILDDAEMVSDLVVIAMNQALEKIDQESQKVMGAFGGGLPGFF